MNKNLFPSRESSIRVFAMLAVNAAYNQENYCEDCKNTGLTKDRTDCHCRENLPYRAEVIREIISQYP